MCIEDTRIESICIRVIYIVSVVSPLPLLLIGITFYISLLFLSANELRSEGIILKNRYRKTFANKITNSRLNIRHISRRLDQTDRTLRVIYIYIYMVTISASTHRTLLFRVSSVSLSLLSLYALLYLHVSALYSEIHDSSLIIIMK